MCHHPATGGWHFNFTKGGASSSLAPSHQSFPASSCLCLLSLCLSPAGQSPAQSWVCECMDLSSISRLVSPISAWGLECAGSHCSSSTLPLSCFISQASFVLWVTPGYRECLFVVLVLGAGLIAKPVKNTSNQLLPRLFSCRNVSCYSLPRIPCNR